jgi:hypothetical protein
MGSTLKTFDDPKDYVYDVQWSPQHPALFSAVDGQGYLSIFDCPGPPGAVKRP